MGYPTTVYTIFYKTQYACDRNGAHYGKYRCLANNEREAIDRMHYWAVDKFGRLEVVKVTVTEWNG